MFRSILVPIDGSQASRDALAVALHLVSGPDPTIHLLNVPELPPAGDELGRWVGATSLDASRSEVEQSAYEMLKAEKQAVEGSDANFQLIVRWGATADTIVAEAAHLGVDAVVMGSRGLSDLKGLAVGSVSHKVMHTAECRVITVH